MLSRVLPRVARGLLAAVVTLIPVALLALLVREQFDPLIRFDDTAIRHATDVTRAHPALRTLLIVVQTVLQERYVYTVTLLIAVVVWRRGLRARAVWGAVTMLVGWNLGLLVKLAVQRARPVVTDPVSHAPGYSFPSGHVFNTTFALTVTLLMAWPLLGGLSRGARRALVAAVAVVVVVTCLDRVYLGVHFPSDTVAGIILALALAFSSWLGYRGGVRAPITSERP